MHLHLFAEPLDRKDAISVINAVRDSLKHFSSGEAFQFDAKEEAYHLIDRALGNYLLLSQAISSYMRRFLELRGPDV